MKLLTFQAKRFGWTAFSQTLEWAPEPESAKGQVTEAVVAFMHIEQRDEPTDKRKRAFKHTLKHLKWLANKNDLKTIVLHSFTHLGGVNADPHFALEFIQELAARLSGTGYHVAVTPFGWFSSWTIDVYGHSLAKVYKEIG
jgi:hypothetical protein